MRDFKTLDVWEQAHMLAQSVDMLIEDYPGLVRSGLAPPMRRESISIAANIAQGCGRSDVVGEQWYFKAAVASATCFEYLVLLARDLALIPEDHHEWFSVMAVQIQGKLRALMAEKEAPVDIAPAAVATVQ